MKAFLALLLAALVAVIIFGDLPGDRSLFIAAQDSAHAYAFVALVWLLLRLRPAAGSTARRYLSVFAVAVGIGVGIEIIQGLIGRDASANDVLRDALGAVSGICLHHAMTQSANGRHGSRLFPVALAIAALGHASWPTAAAALTMIQKAHRFPVIAHFSPPLHRPLDHGRYPGIAFDEPYPDWTGYRTLVIDLINPDPRRDLTLTVRVHDREHNQNYRDRYNRRFTLPAARHERLRISLHDVRVAPQGREMDMRRIEGVILFSQGPKPGREFYLEGVWLE